MPECTKEKKACASASWSQVPAQATRKPREMSKRRFALRTLIEKNREEGEEMENYRISVRWKDGKMGKWKGGKMGFSAKERHEQRVKSQNFISG